MKYGDVEYVECKNVYPPSEDTFLLIDNLKVKENSTVLEIGAGSGLVSIFASRTASSVVCTDINPDAIKCIRKNIELNNVPNISIVQCDLFGGIDDKFDLILFNTPYLPEDNEFNDNSDYSKAWNGGVDGRAIIDSFLKEVYSYLNDDGVVQLVQSSFSDNDKTLDYLNHNGFDAEITESIHMFFEDITLITAKKK